MEKKSCVQVVVKGRLVARPLVDPGKKHGVNLKKWSKQRIRLLLAVSVEAPGAK